MADFIITSLQPWDIEIGSTIKNTALEISKQNRVFYINTLPGLWQWMREYRILSKRNDVIINKNMHVVYCNTPLLPAGSMPFKWLFKMVNYYNNHKIAQAIKRSIRRYNIHKYTHIIDTDIFRSRYLKQLLQPEISIYYRRDYVIGVDYWKKYGPACEKAIVSQSDIVLTNSSYFTEELKPLNPNIYTTNTGVNLKLYDARIKHEIPDELVDLPSPIIGYTGAIIERRLDSKLLYILIQTLPEYNFVFVGPEDEHFRNHQLHQLENVVFIGHKEVEKLPQYIQHFDVCINPQLVNAITEGNYPLKVDEYLAMGKPVVATSTHTMHDVFGNYTHLADDSDSWIKALRVAVNEALDAELSEKRIAFAHTHSWAHSVEKIYKAIDDYENTKSIQ